MRDDIWEGKHAGEHVADLKDNWPPCIAERGTFMSDRSIALMLNHKLGHDEAWEHLQPTPFVLPSYSAPALPFRWLSREGATSLVEAYPTGYDAEREPKDGWKEGSSWVLDPINQNRCLTAFWSAIQPSQSLCFFYAKAIPGVEDPRRVIVGVGRVSELLPLRQYVKGDTNGYEAWVWERPVKHTIRPNFLDGFVLPYHALLEKTAKDSALLFSDYVAFAPEEHRDEFSFVSEHVTSDAALRSLENCRVAIERVKTRVTGPWDRVLEWINDRCSETRRSRGAYPGLGAGLTAFGVSQGMIIASELTRELPIESDPWVRVQEAFENSKILPAELRSQITPALQTKFKHLQRSENATRFLFLRLLSRFALASDQMRLLWNKEQRDEVGIEYRDEDFVANPYLLYEECRQPAVLVVTHRTEDADNGEEEEEEEKRVIAPISFWTVDRGVFLSEPFGTTHLLPPKAQMSGPDDPRRVRALAMHVLHRAETEGHSVLPLAFVAQRGAEMTLEPPCPIDTELIEALQDKLEDRLFFHELVDGKRTCQLVERDEICTHIRNLLRRVRRGTRISINANWREMLDHKLGPLSGKKDERARIEKSEALREVAESRFSVLIGPAGTGKTTLLRALCAHPTIQREGVLLLAPTGKARVRLQLAVKSHAQTLAQFLLPFGRYEPATAVYRVDPTRETERRYKTVIVDEASMLTEDQLAALAETVASADRIILVGDPAQLPPIGVGRPFVDLVKGLEPDKTGEWPRIARGYAELTVHMRQDSGGEDLQLAELFSGRAQRAGDDEIIFSLVEQPTRPRIRCARWDTPDDLHKQLREILADEFQIKGGLDDMCGTLGGVCDAKGRWYFNQGAENMIENWQVLAPVHLLPGGTEDLNRLLQREFRNSMLKYATGRQMAKFRVPRPVGPQQVVYGDKVINVSNQKNRWVRPSKLPDGEQPLRYIANGEIGVVIGEALFGEPFDPWLPWRVYVAFGSQPGFRYSFSGRAFKEEGDCSLELAYAITVHKSQGSEFGRVILIVPEQAPTLCRELLYTALTRHKEKLIVLHQGEITNLLRFTVAGASATARRFTNINIDDERTERRPLPLAIKDRQSGRTIFYEQSLIHRTRTGLLVRSKSEVIIANELDYARERGRLTYDYEIPLSNPQGGWPRYPDFTIRDESLGRVWYWEHRGMLSDEDYLKRWEAKERWYRKLGIQNWDPTKNPDGQLILTEDGPDGEIDASQVKRIVRSLLK
jgi:hypothetical protein